MKFLPRIAASILENCYQINEGPFLRNTYNVAYGISIDYHFHYRNLTVGIKLWTFWFWGQRLNT